jgi:hypothetical protein
VINAPVAIIAFLETSLTCLGTGKHGQGSLELAAWLGNFETLAQYVEHSFSAFGCIFQDFDLDLLLNLNGNEYFYSSG